MDCYPPPWKSREAGGGVSGGYRGQGVPGWKWCDATGSTQAGAGIPAAGGLGGSGKRLVAGCGEPGEPRAYGLTHPSGYEKKLLG